MTRHECNLARVSSAWLATKSPTGFLRPSEQLQVERPPSGAGWLHEVTPNMFS
jgi:hypothetical protein